MVSLSQALRMPPIRLPAEFSLSGPSRRILCVDADAEHCRALCVALSRPGTTIECVNAAAAALHLLTCDAQEWDLLLVSERLPDLDALEVLRHGRSAGFAGPAILLSDQDVPRAHALSLLQHVLVLPPAVPPRQLRAAADVFVPRAA
jgi:DNA-binding response OmpR family regulator